jgi:hypothetical protein
MNPSMKETGFSLDFLFSPFFECLFLLASKDACVANKTVELSGSEEFFLSTIWAIKLDFSVVRPTSSRRSYSKNGNEELLRCLRANN